MRATLQLHPDYACDAVERLDVEVARAGANVLLRYVVTGRIADLALPEVTAPVRADDLWRHTCFELFVREPDNSYVEFNFAPSSHWAGYRFARYRGGRSDVEIPAPHIDCETRADRYEMRVSLAWPHGGPMAISTVIEEASGRLSYWAARHAPDKADFHHTDGFVLTLEHA
ncbi:MAG: DOMON-like domain-containing protein [Hyphomonadaceae bacterium]|nr:DOMON-like domain-containing protein [Hyphomonadaceae bacterium]